MHSYCYRRNEITGTSKKTNKDIFTAYQTRAQLLPQDRLGHRFLRRINLFTGIAIEQIRQTYGNSVHSYSRKICECIHINSQGTGTAKGPIRPKLLWLKDKSGHRHCHSTKKGAGTAAKRCKQANGLLHDRNKVVGFR